MTARTAPQIAPTLTLSVRVRLLQGGEVAFGPGKASLLRALGRTGSIRAAAAEMGVSYMHAWKLIQTMNRCLGAEVVASARGGTSGGGARVTPLGLALLANYDAMTQAAQAAAQTAWVGVSPQAPRFPIALSTLEDIDPDLMEQSIRNELPGTIKEIVSDKVLTEVVIETALGDLASVITTRSVREMGLKIGDRVAALVKATNVSLRRQDPAPASKAAPKVEAKPRPKAPRRASP